MDDALMFLIIVSILALIYGFHRFDIGVNDADKLRGISIMVTAIIGLFTGAFLL